MIDMTKTRMYTVQEAAEASGLTHGRICQLLRSGEIKGQKVGRLMWLIPESEVRRIAERGGGPGRPRSGTPRLSR